MALPHTHDDIRWPDGRRIVTDRVFPHDIERSHAPDWTWTVEDYDLGDPSGSYFVTEAEALTDARQTIDEQDACPHPPEARVTYGGGVAAPYGRETDPTYCDLCGERVDG